MKPVDYFRPCAECDRFKARQKGDAYDEPPPARPERKVRQP